MRSVKEKSHYFMLCLYLATKLFLPTFEVVVAIDVEIMGPFLVANLGALNDMNDLFNLPVAPIQLRPVILRRTTL